MTSLNSFKTTNSYQELTGVSGVTGNFTLQNKGITSFLIYIGETPNDSDSIIIRPYIDKNLSSCYLTGDGEKVWVKSLDPTTIGIIQE